MHRILLTGSTGYVGGRLLKHLENKYSNIRCMVRNPNYLKYRVSSQTEVVFGDVLKKETLFKALKDVSVAYYLIHAMGESNDFEKLESIGAKNFAEAAKKNNVSRIIYLGGLCADNKDISPHLRSRIQVGEILKSSGINTIEFRSSIIIGSGSLSFEMIRALTEYLPFMIMPRWVSVLAQPIFINDLLKYLINAIEIEIKENHIFEIGGKDQLSYKDLIKEYARQRNLKRILIQVPVLTPRLSSLWLGIVTPLYSRVGKKLIESIRHPTIVQDRKAELYFNIDLYNSSKAIKYALKNEEREFAETKWYDSVSSGGTKITFGGEKFGNRLIDHRKIKINKTKERIFNYLSNMGGENGWPSYNLLWSIRGNVDLILGGVGMRRGRPLNRKLRIGDAVDFWRVDKYKNSNLLVLKAEMKLPGQAWLEFFLETSDESIILHQTAIFYPRGFLGLVYWYGIYPLHSLIFESMIENIAIKS